jgi:hypothetical protein
VGFRTRVGRGRNLLKWSSFKNNYLKNKKGNVMVWVVVVRWREGESERREFTDLAFCLVS